MIRIFKSSGRTSLTAIALAGAALPLGACGGQDPGSELPTENTGTVGLELDVGSDITLESVAWEITGNGVARSGTFNVENSTKISGIIGGLPAGRGYTITLVAVATNDASIVCSGSATFAITAGQVTTAEVRLTCTLPDGNGSVKVEGTVNVCPRVDAVSADPAETTIGNTIELSATATEGDGGPAPLAYSWTASSGVLSDASSANPSFTCTTAGEATLTLTVTDSECGDTASLTLVCSPPGGSAPPPITINEVESSGGTPGDWVELFNSGAAAADVSGFVFRDNDDTHSYTIPAGTTLAPGAYLVLEEAAFGFGLGGGDSARLFAANGTTVVDSYAWTAHAATTYARCPNGTGAFATSTSSSKGGVNDCPGVVTLAPWPGADNAQTADGTSVFGGNLSGLTYEAAVTGSPAVLWAVRNGPGTLFRLLDNGTIWTPDTANDWSAGKPLRYVDGTGNPDSEGVTRAEAGTTAIYVATERNNDSSTISRPSILRVDAAAAGTSLSASHEWALVSDLPVVGANLGPEAITWIPDTFLTSNSFFDESKGHAYDPSEYPGHGSGLFFVGLEANGTIYAYALDHGGNGFSRVATILSGFPGSMGIEFDREVGNLWAACDDTCEGQSAVLKIDTTAASATFGRFVVRRKFARPTTLPNLNNEGIAIAPEAECVSGQKSFFWADDGESGGHSIRRDTIPCGSFF
jgi:hypothetical protein